MIKSALLVLEDGTQFIGRAIGATGSAVGEVVFNTSMTGYQEILTDPSYSRQIVTLTYPHIGNVGTNAADEESSQVHAQGLVIRDLPEAKKESDLPFHVVAYDFGAKRNILRMLVDRGCRLTVVPAKTSAEEVLKMNPDGIFLSNGPGDPAPCDYAIDAIKSFLETDIPVFGICLGHQLLALASGANTVKMKFGHHGGNHPVKDIDNNTVMITAQNHGFAVDEASMPANLRVTHKSLFDGTLQGIHRTDKPAFSFQGHPEASPGPHDAAPLFDHFIELIEQYRKTAK
ncbi:MAG: carbamoyl phosphate synthase small subunit [Enterobacter ludwigii]|nr:carbamoyl phosphate synthase small subunit [Enterobacter ludwigii]